MFMMFGLLIMSAESSYGMVTFCNATQNMSCYGALGGTVYLQLMNDATGSELTFKKDPTGSRTVIFKIKQNKIIHELIKARSEFFINNGTLKINNTERSDSAKYSLEIFNSDGLYLDTRGVQLIIGGGSYGTAIGSLVAVVLVLAVVVGAYCIRKRRNPPQASDAVESPELECDDITILKKREKQREVPEEVVYGQIVVLEGARPNTERDRPEGQEETLYAGIQLGQ
ncbi:si:zfos-741a10.3 [Oncorhynchus mykiss]|uniref:si:zfos-741a10.3 n=1 Tax=Oncorhynchus mykiss TaxID=8022 RepID=UPI001877DE74|nr:si:zfos-741a10.3 [Oncorhynchus mykiss]